MAKVAIFRTVDSIRVAELEAKYTTLTFPKFTNP